MNTLVAALTYQDSEEGRGYQAWLVPEGVRTDDHRFILSGSISWREGRLPLTFSDSEDGHSDATHVGNLDNLRLAERDGTTWVVADVAWDDDETATEARRLVDEDKVRGVSVHASADGGIVCADTIEDLSALNQEQAIALVQAGMDWDSCADPVELAWGLKVLGATLVLIPAFEGTEVVVASVSGAADLPLADREAAWDAPAAQASMFGDDDESPDFATARKGHLFVREEGENKGDYLLPFAEKTDGTLRAVPRGVFAAAGGRGVDRVADLSDEDRDRIKARICGYYARMAKEFDDDAIECPFEEMMAVRASIDLLRPPVGWFDDPKLTRPNPLTFTAEGRVFGHLALWGTCHRGFPDLCVTPPRDSTEYHEFHSNARVTTAEGVLMPVGVVTMDAHHADIRGSVNAAKAHYDHSGTVAAYVRAGNDDHGVWVAGAVDPSLSAGAREKCSRLSLSGDWRPVNGRYVLVSALAVPVPGFPIRARVAGGEITEMQTLGPPQPEPEKPDLILVTEALERVAALVASLSVSVAPLVSEFTERRAIERAEAALAAMA